MEDKPIFTRKFTTEFNTGADSLRQIAQMEWYIDCMFDQIYTDGLEKNDIPMIKKVFHYVTYIYADRIRCLAWGNIKEVFIDKENELETMFQDWIKNHKAEIPTSFVKKIRDYKLWLYIIKQQKIKAGIPTKEEFNAKERLDKVVGV